MTWPPLLAAAPWLAGMLAVLWRVRQSRSLASYDAAPPLEPLPLTVIIPARNEEANIARCVRSIVQSTYPALEVIVVDDHSADATLALAREAAAADARVRVASAPPLAAGWLGKQWACAYGASLARGTLLCFTDADTAHGPELHVRSVRALIAREADLLSVAGTQELGTFWERLIQPQIFALLFARYGGTEVVSRARRAEDVIANGQYMLFRRPAYDALGGHAIVRDKVAEDLGLAMQAKRRGMRVHLILAPEHLVTRMYESLGALVRGWMKNVYAGGIEAGPQGRLWRVLYPAVLLSPIVVWLAPPTVLALSGLGFVLPPIATWAIATSVVLLVWWLIVYGLVARRPWYALLAPLGNVILGYIFVRAIARGKCVEWKGREYRVG